MAAYKKLSGQRYHERKYSRLWLAGDHLFLATATGYTEEYRRFYFADIQAMFIRKTRDGAFINCMLGAIALVFIVLGIVLSEALLICLPFAGMCLVVAGINTVLSPTCSVEVQTAVATHPLPPLRRLRNSRRIIARLTSIITAAQGETTPEQLATITTAPPSPAALS